jgi:hypothetical protein
LVRQTCINSVPVWFHSSQTLNYLAFQSFDFERTWWRLFQKRVVRSKFNIHVFISLTVTEIKISNKSVVSYIV